MTHWLMKFSGEVFPSGDCKGFCIMTETERRGYETTVRNYFLKRKDKILLISNSSNIVRYDNEFDFWNCVKWVAITTEETYILSELELNDYGIYPTQEDFEYEIY